MSRHIHVDWLLRHRHWLPLTARILNIQMLPSEIFPAENEVAIFWESQLRQIHAIQPTSKLTYVFVRVEICPRFSSAVGSLMYATSSTRDRICSFYLRNSLLIRKREKRDGYCSNWDPNPQPLYPQTRIIAALPPTTFEFFIIIIFNETDQSSVHRCFNGSCLCLCFFLVLILADLLSDCPQYLLNKPQKVQKNAARRVLRASKTDHISPHLAFFHWLPTDSRVQYKPSSLSYKCFS